MTAFNEPPSDGGAKNGNGSTPGPFGSGSPFASRLSSPPAFGSASPFLGGGDGGGFGSGADLFSDPREVIKKAIQIVRTRWFTGFLAALVVGAAVGFALFRFRPIEAQAETTLLAQSPLDQILNPDGSLSGDLDHQESVLTNHLSVMMSRTFRQRLADRFTPEERTEIQRPYLKEGQEPSEGMLLGILAKKITVTRERDKDFFTVTVKHVVPDTALMIANRFTSTYLELVQSELHKANEAAAAILTKQADALNAQIMSIEDERRGYRKAHNLISAEENKTILDDRIKAVNLARSDLRVQRARLDAEVRQAKADLAASPLPFSNSVLSAYAGMQTLREQLDQLEVERDVLAIRYGPNHARMVEVEGNIRALRDALARDYQLAFSDIESQLDLAVAAEAGLNAEFDEAFNESLDLSRYSSQLDALGQQADDKRKTLDELFQRIGKASIDTGLPADVLRVIDAAYIHRPLVPMLAVYIGMIGFFALGAFVTAPLAVNFFDERIHENVDLEAKFKLDIIGAVPRLNRIRKEERPHIVRDNVDLAYAESFITLASQIELVSKKPLPRRIAITSTLPGEGKSTLASNLASAYTRLGRRTVLVDCDFRKPAQRNIHKIGGESGLLPWARAGFDMGSDLLLESGPLCATVLPDGTMLIPAGDSDPQPARYLVAEGMARFFALLRQEFEIVIVDTPPAGIFQDALILARYCDDTLFLARDGKANTGQVTRILADFGKTASPALGIVLNGFSPSSSHPKLGHQRLYRQYGYYAPAPRRGAGKTRDA